MIYSMTGYGKAETVVEGIRYEIEIKSVNGKNFDLNLRMPQWFRHKETEIRKKISNRLLRGKISVFISWEDLRQQPANQLRTGVLDVYWKQLKSAFPGLDQSTMIAALLRQSDVWEQEKHEEADRWWEALQPAWEEALDELERFRLQEGAEIERDMSKHVSEIKEDMNAIKGLAPGRIAKIKEKIASVIEEIRQSVEPARFEAEILFYLEKLDINEELSRLDNHLKYFLEVLRSPEKSKGKKLNFIAQEMGREINTTGAKANDAEIQKHVVRMKDSLEKIKEQTANVL